MIRPVMAYRIIIANAVVGAGPPVEVVVDEPLVELFPEPLELDSAARSGYMDAMAELFLEATVRATIESTVVNVGSKTDAPPDE